MNEVNAIIVDDEPKACQLLKLMIEEIDPSINIFNVYTDPQMALTDMDQESTDVIFLDIDMPRMSGFEFLRALGKTDALVVFVTGYDQYAIQALKLAAVGYILKPVSTEELSLACAEIHRRINQQVNQEQYKILLNNINAQQTRQRKIGIPSLKGIDFIKIDDIISCEGTEKYTKVKIENEPELLSSYNIGEFTKLIGDMGFYQVHRSYLINLNKIKQYLKEGTLVMDDGSHIPVARRRKDEFLKLMKTLNR